MVDGTVVALLRSENFGEAEVAASAGAFGGWAFVEMGRVEVERGGVERIGGVISLLPLVKLTDCKPGGAEIGGDDGRVRIEREGMPVAFQSFAVVLQLEPGGAEIVEGVRVIGAQGESSFVVLLATLIAER